MQPLATPNHTTKNKLKLEKQNLLANQRLRLPYILKNKSKDATNHVPL